MNMYKLINILSNYFQYNFEIICDNKKYKEGKLILISDKEFYIKFNYIDKKHNKTKLFEFPLPYNIIYDKKNNCIELDYTFKTLCGENYELLLSIKKIDSSPSKHLFYDKIVKIKFF